MTPPFIDPSGFPKKDSLSESEIKNVNSVFGKVLEFDPQELLLGDPMRNFLQHKSLHLQSPLSFGRFVHQKHLYFSVCYQKTQTLVYDSLHKR